MNLVRSKIRRNLAARSLILVIVAGILARIALLMLLSDGLPDLRKLEPSIIAANINAGKGFVYEQYGAEYRAWKEPLYIGVLAWLTRCAENNDLAVIVFQSFFGILTAIGVMFLARHILGDTNKAALAGVIAAANPFLVYYDTQFIHPLSMDAFLFIAVIGAILFAAVNKTGSFLRTIIAGVVMGLAMWQRASLLAAGVVMWIARIILGSERRRRIAIHGILWLCVSMIIISPWLIRNYKITNRFLVTTDFAHILWLGNNPSSNGTYSDELGRRVIIHASPELKAAMRGASEIGQYDIFMDEVRSFIKENPLRFSALALQRMRAFVWFSPNAGIEYTLRQGILYRGIYAGLLSLGLLGMWLFWQRASEEERRRFLVMTAAVLGIALTHAVTAINLKHRVPFELILSIFSAEGISFGLAACSRVFAVRGGQN